MLCGCVVSFFVHCAQKRSEYLDALPLSSFISLSVLSAYTFRLTEKLRLSAGFGLFLFSPDVYAYSALAAPLTKSDANGKRKDQLLEISRVTCYASNEHVAHVAKRISLERLAAGTMTAEEQKRIIRRLEGPQLPQLVAVDKSNQQPSPLSAALHALSHASMKWSRGRLLLHSFSVRAWVASTGPCDVALVERCQLAMANHISGVPLHPQPHGQSTRLELARNRLTGSAV